MPEGQFPINPEDKKLIVEIGRKFHALVLDFSREKGGTLHMKHVVGACEYVTQILWQKRDIIGFSVSLAQDTLEKSGLTALLNEPFNDPEPVPPTKEERVAFLKKELADLEGAAPAAALAAAPVAPAAAEAPKADPAVEAASIAPKAAAAVDPAPQV